MKLFRLTLLFFTALSVHAQIVVNEIMYNPPSHNAREEWVELLNTSSTNVDLSGWTISGGIDFAFPSNTIIGPGRYLVVAADRTAFLNRFPSATNVVGSWLNISVINFNGRLLTNATPVLSNSRNSVNLNNAEGDRVDSVTYADAGDWAIRRLAPPDVYGRRGWTWTSDADGLGSSLELRNPALPNQYGQNWTTSPIGNPTPGRINAAATNNIPPMVVEVNHAPVIPRSTDPVTINARVIDESSSGLAVSLYYRVDSNSPPPFAVSAMFDDGNHNDASPGDGIYGIVLSAMPNNTLIEFYVEAADAQGKVRSWPAPSADSATPHDANAMFQVDDTIYSGSPPTYKFIMTTAQYNYLQDTFNSPNSDAQVNITFISIDATGLERRYLCGTRNRGHGSRNGQPHNYRLNVPDDTPWKGVTGFNINARVVSSQVVGAAIAQKAGAAGNRSRFIQLRVNNGVGPGGTPPNGLYAGNEDISGDWAERQFPNNGEGNVYSVYRDITPPNFNYRGEDPNQYRNTYFKESNTAEDDWLDLISMLSAMGENQTSLWDTDTARQVINVEQWLLHLAVMNLFGNNETGLNTGYNDDYYLYRGDVDPRFVLVYHDLDTILGLGGSLGANNQNLFSAGTSNGGEGSWRAMNFFLHHPDIEPIYYRTLQNLLDTTFSKAQFDSLVDSVFADFPALAGNATTVKGYMDTRRTTVQNLINGLVPPVVPTPTATISGEPRSPTWRNSATLTIGGVTEYQWRLNNGPYSALTPASTPITLLGLPNGSTNTVYVFGRSNGIAQVGSTVSRTWVVNTATPAVRLNEVLARNVSAVNVGGNFPDLIELFNEGTSPVSLDGWRLTDDITTPGKFVFPPTASLAAGAYMVLSEDDLGFGLDAGGEGVFLFDAAGSNPLDSVSFGPQLPNLSIGRVGAGGAWLLGQPSFNGPTVTVPTGSAAGVRINEWLAFGGPSNPDDLIELYNTASLPADLAGYYLTDNPLGFPNMHRMPELSFIAGGGFLVLTADGDASKPDHVNFQLGAEQGEIGLFSPQVTPVDCVYYGPQHRDVPVGRCPDGANSIRTGAIPTFGFANLCPVPPQPPQIISILPITNTWRYLTSGNLDGTNWQAPGYNDSSWPQGQPLFGNGTGVQEPIRTPFNTIQGQMTYYFRSTFTFPTNLNANSLQFSNIVDDGAVFYINGREVARVRLPSGPIVWSTPGINFGGTPPWEGPLTIALTNVQPGLNTIAVELHQRDTGGGDILFGTRLDAIIVTNTPGAAGIVINEVLASNSSYTNLDGSTPDLVELYNPSTNAVDLAGMIFTDDPANPLKRWVVPSGTILEGSGYRVFQFDGDKPASATNAGFGLDANGDRLYLLTAETQYLDSIEFGLQPEDYSIGRIPNGASNWVLNLPTPGSGNGAALLGNVRNLKVNEWMPAPAGNDADWFEIYNPEPFPVEVSGCFLSDVAGVPMAYLPIANLSFLGAGTNAWKKFIADANVGAGANHAPFRMNNTAEVVILSDPNGGQIDSISWSYPVAQIGISEGRLPDGTENFTMFPGTDSPGEANYVALTNIFINEILTHTDLPLEDAIEIYNSGPNNVNIGGWWLSDSRRKLQKYQIPPNTTILAGSYAVFYEEKFNSSDFSGDPFALGSDGDEVYLSPIFPGAGLNGYRASAKFGAAANGVSFGRYRSTAGDVDYPALTRRTFGHDNALTVQDFRLGVGASNAYPIVGPVVFTEIMYHPPDIAGQDNVGHEFIELYNVTSNSVALYDPAHPTNTWRLRDAVDFNFPPNSRIAPGGYLILVSFDPATNAPALTSFRTKYGTNFILFGPYSGKLDNSDDSVELYRPDAPNPDGKVPYILVERIRYSDRAPWYPAADGLGFSLQRRSAYAYGNEPTNWTAAAFNPGPSGANDNDGDGMPNAWEMANGFNPNSSADASQDFDGDGFTNLQEYQAGTNPRSAQSFLELGPISRGPGALLIDFQAAAGITYSIIYRPLVHTGAWTKLIDIPAQSTTQWIRVFDPSPDPQRFYRLVTPSLTE